MLNYGIIQNQDAPHYESQSHLSLYELPLYKAKGDETHKMEQETKAIAWCTVGLALARELKSHEKIALFSEYIHKPHKNAFSEMPLTYENPGGNLWLTKN